MRRGTVFFCCLLASSLRSSFSQQTAPAPPPVPAAAPSPSPAPASPTVPGAGPSQGRPGYGSLADDPSRRPPSPADPWDFGGWGGKVVLDTGGPPPGRAGIDLRCGAQMTRVAYTRPDGRFVYSELNPPGDARSYSTANSTYSNVPFNWPTSGTIRANRADCQLRAVLAGYGSTVAFPFRQRGWREPADEITLVLHKTGDGGGGVSSPTSQTAPPAARKAFERGLEAAEKGNPADALKNFQKAVEIYPRYAAAWHELGRVEVGRGRLPQAREDYSRALGADPGYVKPYLELAALASAEKNWAELADYSATVIKLNPADFPGAYIYNALAHYNLNHLDAAQESLREALRRDQEHHYPEANYMLGNILAERGDYSGAQGSLRAYLELAPDGPYAPRTREQLAQLEKLAATRPRQAVH